MNLKRINYRKSLFYIVIVSTIIILINGTYLPMVDLPQHAAQVTALDNLLKGGSSWDDLVEVNFLTPYLLGYFIWLVLFQFFDILLSSRIFISIIFILFVYSICLIRKELGATYLVTWISIPSFFGFSYEWGFVTFLLSISIGLIFFFVNLRWFKSKKPYFGLIVIFTGIILFFTHILSFLFFGLLSLVFLIFSSENIKEFIKLGYPNIIFFLLIIMYIMQVDTLSNQYDYGMVVSYDNISEKIIKLINYPWTMHGNYHLISIFLMVSPFLSGFKVSKNKIKFIPLLVFLGVWFTLPHFLFNTYFVYERYSILFFCFYYLIFEENISTKTNKIGLLFYFLAIFYLLVQDYISISLAKAETTSFSEIINEIPNEKRMLGLIFEPTSAGIGIPFTYIHYASWYQAQKNGWSDFNFAWFHPQIVRYKKTSTPEVKPGFEWNPTSIHMLNNCESYDFLLIRAYSYSFEKSILNSECKNYKPFKKNGVWFVYQK